MMTIMTYAFTLVIGYVALTMVDAEAETTARAIGFRGNRLFNE